VMGKLTRQGAGGASIVAVEDREFSNAKLTELATNYKREAMALKVQVEMFADYAKVTVIRLDPNKPATRKKVVQVKYNSQTNEWKVPD